MSAPLGWASLLDERLRACDRLLQRPLTPPQRAAVLADRDAVKRLMEALLNRRDTAA